MQFTHEWEEYCKNHQREVIDLIRQLVAIPAFSNQEKERAQFCAQWLQSKGAVQVSIDKANNVIMPLGDQSTDLVAFLAHLDTVFPDETGFELIVDEQQGLLKAPGVGDDTTNLALLMVIIEGLLKGKLTPKQGLLFVFNSGEEGLGNLKGCRQLLKDYEGRIKELYSFDGSYKGLVNKAVGSVRYRVEVKTEGGHSYGAFGNRNAIFYLSKMIDDLYAIKVPEGSKTTYNVGTIQGGTSVNTIAQQAEMLFEFRSDEQAHLDKMTTLFDSLIETYRLMDIEVLVEILGQRPCMGEIDQVKQKEIQDFVCEIIEKRVGIRPELHSGSTDCNIPFSLGINSLCFGGYIGKGAHTRQEQVEISSLLPGMSIMSEFILSYFVD